MVEILQEGSNPLARRRVAFLPTTCRRSDEFHLARLGSIVDPAKDLVRSSNHDVFCLQRRADGKHNNNRPHRGSPGRLSVGQPGASGAVAVLSRFCAPQGRRVRHAVQQRLLDELRSGLRVRGHHRSVCGRSTRESLPSSLIANSWEARVVCLAAMSELSGQLPPQATAWT